MFGEKVCETSPYLLPNTVELQIVLKTADLESDNDLANTTEHMVIGMGCILP